MEEMSKERRAVGTLVAAQLCLIGVFSLGAGSALADSPHFVKQDAVLDGSGNLDCSFKVAGLGDNQSILVTCSADASAFYACFNKGGNHPQASNKEESAGPVSGSDEFTSGKNGQVTGSVEVNPPASTLTCPGNQVRRLCSVSYTNIVLTADSLQASVPGTLSREFVDCF